MTGGNFMIRIRQLRKVYTGSQNQGVTALEDVNLHIGRGDVFGIIGPSGAGKSTLLRCINMLERPTSGSICIDGTEITGLEKGDLREIRRRMGMVFQHFNLLSSRTVYRNIAFPMEVSGASKSETRRRVGELLSIVGLEDKAKAYPAELSGGQKQRVGIARALATSPKILLCDEATSALDPNTTQSVLELLKSINAEFGITIVMVTHQMQVIKQVCNNVAVIERGRVVEQAGVEELFSRPGTETAKGLVQGMGTADFNGRPLRHADARQPGRKEVVKNVG
jgi:D-methionine transport system ATP-binding protein